MIEDKWKCLMTRGKTGVVIDKMFSKKEIIIGILISIVSIYLAWTLRLEAQAVEMYIY